MKRTLVSVVLIFFDAGEFLDEAIESVFRQTYESWELLLVDDGSTDRSTEIARDVAQRHPERVRYLEHDHHANRGMSASRNAGIGAAHGEHLSFLDADDVWLPSKLAEQVAILEERPEAALVYGAATYWNSWRGRDARDVRRPLGVDGNRSYSPPYLLTRALRSRVPTPCPSDVLVRRSVALDVGGFDERFRGLFEDQVFLAKIYLRATVYVASKSWFLYRQHDSALAHSTADARKYEAGLHYFEWLERYLLEHGVTDRELWRALRQKRRRYAHPAYDRLFRAGLRAQGRLRRGTGWETKRAHGALQR